MMQPPWYVKFANWFGRRPAGAKTAIPVETHVEKTIPAFDRTPDLPQSFGYKVSWFAVRTNDPAQVIDLLVSQK